jgi:hypothetical protein
VCDAAHHKWQSGNWQSHHGNAVGDSAKLVWQFLAKHSILQVIVPPADIALCDFLVPKT